MTPSPTMIELRALRFHYPEGPAVLRGLDLTLREGESVGLLGPNGSGKSTLLQLLMGLQRGEGSIRIAGLDLTRHNIGAIRQRAGLLFQDSDAQLFMPTVAEDVAFGPLNMGMSTEEALAAARAALHDVGLHDAALEARGAHQLSGGEKRRVALATILAMKPGLLLLDEPSLNLDPRARRELIALLGELPGTRLITSHDLDLVWDLCERVLILNEGRIVADGPAEEILRDEALLLANGLDAPLSLQPRPAARASMRRA